MKILYDNLIFQHQTIGGISRYCYELMNYYYSTKILDFNFPVYYSLNQYIQNSEFTSKMQFLMSSPLCKIGEFRKFLRKKNNSAVLKELKSNKYDIFHPSYYSDYFLDALNLANNTKLVITIHDMIIEAFKDSFSEQDFEFAKNKKLLAQRADKIFTVSNFSKSEILKYYPEIPENKVKVIHIASSLKQKDVNIKMQLPKKYLLFVGARRAYKNFNFMISSIAPLLIEKNIKLIVASPWEFDKDELALIDKLQLKDFVILLKPTDAELCELYKNALCYIFPSLYEGFGIPVLEAFEFNCPVLASNVASLPEVGGDACQYFNPKISQSIYDAVKEIIENDDLCYKMKLDGQRRLSDFSWKKTAVTTKSEYEQILEL